MLFIAFSDFLIFGGTMALEAIQLVKCYEKTDHSCQVLHNGRFFYPFSTQNRLICCIQTPPEHGKTPSDSLPVSFCYLPGWYRCRTPRKSWR